MRAKKYWLIPAAALVLGLAGCGADTPETEDEVRFVYARKASVTSFDLHNESTENNAFAIDQVFEPLVMFDEDGVVTDYLADSTISEDGLVYTFVLHDGLKFSNGQDVTAEDVKYSLERHLEVGGPLPIEADIKSIEAVDDRTVVITLNAAYTPFYSELANFSNGIVPKDLNGLSEEEFFAHPVGTGPFMVEEWDPSGDVTFVKNPYYWQEGKPVIDRLVFRGGVERPVLQIELARNIADDFARIYGEAIRGRFIIGVGYLPENVCNLPHGVVSRVAKNGLSRDRLQILREDRRQFLGRQTFDLPYKGDFRFDRFTFVNVAQRFFDAVENRGSAIHNQPPGRSFE